MWVLTVCICHFVRHFGVQNFRTFIVDSVGPNGNMDVPVRALSVHISNKHVFYHDRIGPILINSYDTVLRLYNMDLRFSARKACSLLHPRSNSCMIPVIVYTSKNLLFGLKKKGEKIKYEA